jgi:hypothetical protein
MEHNGADWNPVARRARPALGLPSSSRFIDFASPLEDGVFTAKVALVRYYVADGAVAMLAVVPGDESSHQR